MGGEGKILNDNSAMGYFFQESNYKQEDKKRLINRNEDQKGFYFFEAVVLFP